MDAAQAALDRPAVVDAVSGGARACGAVRRWERGRALSRSVPVLGSRACIFKTPAGREYPGEERSCKGGTAVSGDILRLPFLAVIGRENLAQHSPAARQTPGESIS